MKYIYTFFIVITVSLSSHAQYSLHESIDLSPTAFNLQKGENRLTNTMLVGWSFTHGISNKLSFNIGILAVPRNSNGRASMKYTQTLHEYVHVGISPSLFYSDSDFSFRSDTYSAGLTGILTIGKPGLFINFNYSKGFGAAIFMRSGEIEITDTYNHYSVGGAIQVSKGFSLFTENIFLVDTNGKWSKETSHSIKGRWSFKPNQQIQVGFTCFIEFYEDFFDGMPYIDESSFCWPVPIISYSIYFGKIKT